MTAIDTKAEIAERPAEQRVSLLQATLAGVLAAAVALAVTQLVSALRDGPSLIDTVGTEFIDRFAAPLKDLAVSLFGTNDKTALVTGIVIVCLVVGGLLGRASARRRWIGPVGFAGFAVVGIATGTTDPLASGPLMIVAAVLGGAVGIITLELLLRRARPVSAPLSRRHVEDPRVTQASRRSFLAWSGGAAAVAVVAGGAARSLNSRHTPVDEGISLPPALSMATLPPTQPFDAAGLSDYITPNADFYRIDTALFVPRVNVSNWKLSVQGLVDNPFEISYDELLSMPLVDEPVTIACVSNEVGGDLIGNAVWRGVPLASLLDRAGVQSDATQIVGLSVDEFTVGFPTATALDGRTALVAVGMNGTPLPQRHGFPARLIVAGLYGYVSATKWLKGIVLTRLEDFDAVLGTTWLVEGGADQDAVSNRRAQVWRFLVTGARRGRRRRVGADVGYPRRRDTCRRRSLAARSAR